MIYAFENCTLDTELYELRRDGPPFRSNRRCSRFWSC
jgi:hypothetical protein